MSVQSWGGLITVVAAGVSFALLVMVHLLPTGVNPLRDPLSLYPRTRYRWWMSASTLASAVACVGAVLALSGLLGSGATLAVILLGLGGAARFAMPFRRMDVPGTATTTGGRIHNVLAVVAFAAPTAAAFVAGGALHDAGYTAAATWSTVLGAVSAVGAVALLVVVLARRNGLFGLFERVILLGILGWFVVIGLLALRG